MDTVAENVIANEQAKDGDQTIQRSALAREAAKLLHKRFKVLWEFFACMMIHWYKIQHSGSTTSSSFIYL
jgi:hypothetical protein